MWRARLMPDEFVQSRESDTNVHSAVDEVWRTEAGSDDSCLSPLPRQLPPKAKLSW